MLKDELLAFSERSELPYSFEDVRNILLAYAQKFPNTRRRTFDGTLSEEVKMELIRNGIEITTNRLACDEGIVKTMLSW